MSRADNVQAYYERNRIAIQARDRARYWADPEGPRGRGRRAKPRPRSPINFLQDRAHGLIERLVKKGWIIRQACELCGFWPTQAHHPFGYEGPSALALWWLCVAHHRGMHEFMKETP